MNSFGRRRFVQGIAASAGLLALPRFGFTAAGSNANVLSGTQFDLTIGEIPVNFTGAARTATVVNGQLPAPLLRWREGDDVTIRVTNRLATRTSIHWHGLIVPADMDGVPGISFHGIAPGETFTYRFRVNQSGTYWYHAHSRFQEQVGLYGPIVVEPRDKERHQADREQVILLSDWTDRDPEDIYRALKVHPGYFNFHKRTAGDFVRDARTQGLKTTAADRAMWGQMRMDATDLADVSGYAYTYLMNGATPASNWTALFNRGERVRLRFINGSSMTFFDVRIPGLKLTVVAADGQDIEPVTVDEFRVAPAEIYDVIVTPDDASAYTIFAQSMDRTGYARGTLAPRAGMTAAVPAQDARAVLTMSDMGHGSMSHGQMDHSQMNPGQVNSGQVNHGQMNHEQMEQMDHAQMDHSAHSAATSTTLKHAPAEHGPGVDMLVDTPTNRLDDPGIGLRNNGRRVLTYADLRTLGGPIDKRDAGREIELHLTGHMERFLWSFSGQKFSEATPLRFNYGERLRIVLINDTMMTHPIHLHGMWSEVESPDGKFQVRKHTVNVQPAQRLSYLVTADALGRWAFHCHLLYHMEAGMFREVIVAREGEAS